jgi:plastocyanin
VSAVLAALLLAASVRGTVTITGKKSEALDPSRAVVWLEGRAAPPAVPAKVVMTTRGKKFTPEVLVLPAGSEVLFPNEDSIQHNAFSSSEGNRFDVGLYGPGPGKEVVMRTPGVVRVYCNVHPQMAAFVIVTPTGLAARAKPDGTFEITGVPPGSYELNAWDERGGDLHPSGRGEAGRGARSLRDPRRQPLQAASPPRQGGAVVRGARYPRLPMTLATKFASVATAIVAAVVLAGIGAVWAVMHRMEDPELDAAVARSHELARDVVGQHLRRLALIDTLLANDPPFRAYVTEADALSVLDNLRDRRELYGCDRLIVTDRDGRLLADTKRPAAGGLDLSRDPLIAPALEGTARSGAWLDPAGGLFLAASSPILQGGRDVAGAVVALDATDDALALELRNATGSEVAFVTGSTVSGTSIGVAAGRRGAAPWGSSPCRRGFPSSPMSTPPVVSTSRRSAIRREARSCSCARWSASWRR